MAEVDDSRDVVAQILKTAFILSEKSAGRHMLRYDGPDTARVRRYPDGERGFVLVCVLAVLAILTIATLGFGRRAVLDRRAAAVSIDQFQALCMARGAVQIGIAELRNTAAAQQAEAGQRQPEGVRFVPAWFSPSDALSRGVFSSAPEGEPDDTVTCRFTIHDEEGRVSVNSASETLLSGIKRLSSTAVEEILLQRRVAASTPFLVLEQVREFEGVTENDWYGEKEARGLKDLMSCYGDGRIDLNTAPEEVLCAIPGIREPILARILAYRSGQDGAPGTADDRTFAGLGRAIEEVGEDGAGVAALRTFCKTESRFFTIVGDATRRRGRVRAYCAATVRIQGGDVKVLEWREGPLGS